MRSRVWPRRPLGFATNVDRAAVMRRSRLRARGFENEAWSRHLRHGECIP